MMSSRSNENIQAAVDWLAEHPDLDVTEMKFANDRVELVCFGYNGLDGARAFYKHCGRLFMDKEFTLSLLKLTVKVSPTMEVQAYLGRESVCKQVKTGEVTRKESVPIVWEEREVTRDITEWECPSLMGGV